MTIYTDNNLIDGMTCLYRITATDSLGVSTSVVIDPANMPGHSITAQAIGGDTIAYQVTLVDVGGNVDYEVYVDSELIGSATNVLTPSVSDTLNYTLTPLPGVTTFLVSLWAAPTGGVYTLQQTIEVDLTNVVQPVTRSAQMSIRPYNENSWSWREDVLWTVMIDGTQDCAYQILKDGVVIRSWYGLGAASLPYTTRSGTEQLADTTSVYQLLLADSSTEGQAGNYTVAQTITFNNNFCPVIGMTNWMIGTKVTNGQTVGNYSTGFKGGVTDVVLKEAGVPFHTYHNDTPVGGVGGGYDLTTVNSFDSYFTVEGSDGTNSIESLPWKFLNEPSYGITITNTTAVADTNGFVTVAATINYYGLTVAPRYRIQKRKIGDTGDTDPILQVYPPMPAQSVELTGANPETGGSEQIQFVDNNTVIGHDYEYLIEVYQWDNDCGIYDATHFLGTMPATGTASTSP